MIVLCVATQLYAAVLVARLILGWIEVPATGRLASFTRGVHAATEPPLGAIRTVVPSLRIGTIAVDASPFLLLAALMLLTAFVCH